MNLNRLKRNFILKEEYFSNEELLKIKTENKNDIIDFLISQINNELPEIRNRSALYLRGIRSNRAVKPLFEAILNPRNRNYNGTLVYALETLDCSNHLTNLFKILFFESFEAKVSAFVVLEEQIFEFSKDDLNFIKSLWLIYISNDNIDEDIKNIYEDFMSYLENN